MSWKIFAGAGAFVLLLGTLICFAVSASEDQNAAALRRPPPAAVGVEGFNRANEGIDHEVTIVGQLDLANWMEYTITKNGDEKHHWSMIPLYPASAAAVTGPAPGAMVRDGMITDAEIRKLTIGKGAFGPIVRINGKRFAYDGMENDALNKALGGRVENPWNGLVKVEPFVGGRTAALTPVSVIPLVVVVALLGFGLIGFGLYRRHREPIEEANYYA